MKTCKDCKEVKPYTDFVPKASCADGYEIRCRVCRAARYNKVDPFKVFKKIYLSQHTHSVSRGHPAPAYTLDQLLHWADSQPDLLRIWDAYVSSGYITDLRPSVDRVNDSLPYTLDNIQLLTWKQNRLKGAANKKAGINNSCNRAVKAYNLDGTLHKEYYSVSQAVREVNGRHWGIHSVADGTPVKDGKGYLYTPQTYKGFKWVWA